MEQLSIINPGIGSLIIEAGERRILVDAFNTMTDPPEILSGDIYLFTHDDGDHFSPDQLPDVKKKDITIAGPPSIVKPILLRNKAELRQIEVLSSNCYDNPCNISFGEIVITCYHSSHFNHWDPIHNSYLIEWMGKRIYITGDSLITKEQLEKVGETDVIVCNLVDEDFLKGQTDRKMASHNLMDYLTTIRVLPGVQTIIGTHMIGFDWTADALDMERLVKERGFDNIIIPVSEKQRISL